MWARPTSLVQQDALRLLSTAKLIDPPASVWDVEPDRIFFVGQSGRAKVAIVHCCGAARLVRSVYPGWPA